MRSLADRRCRFTQRLALVLSALALALALLAGPRAASAQQPPGSATASASVRAPVRPPSGGQTTPPEEDRAKSTPRRALGAFLKYARAGDLQRAADFLDLRGLARGREKVEGPELAGMLLRVLEWRVELDAEALPDEPNPPGVGAEGIVLDVAEIGDQTHVLALSQVKLPNGTTAWMFPRTTVAAVRPIYEANQRRWLEEQVPEWLKRRQGPGLLIWQWLGLALLALAAYGVGRGLGKLLVRTIINLVGRYFMSAMSLVRALSRPARLALGVVVFELGVPYLVLPASVERALGKGSNILYIFAAAHAVVGIVRVATSTWEQKLPEDTIGIVENRGLRTRLAMLRRIGTVVVGFVAAGLALLQFEVVRSVGLSILASAGIVGVLVGIAAQRTLGGIIAGIEMSITEPVRIGDMVEFDPGKFGTVEQIYFTYIVVRLWDDRRQIVPVTRVMAAPFENWTRTGVDLLVSVEIFADYAMPIETLREAFRDACAKCEKWDKRSWRVDVMEITDKAIRVRGTASVASASNAYDLRVELRERWFAFLQQLEGGKYLPHGRVMSASVEEAPPPSSRPQLEAPSSTTPDSSSSKPSPKKA